MIFVQENFDNTFTVLNAKSLIASFIHAVLLNLSPFCRSLQIIKGQTMVRFLPVKNMEPREFFVVDDFTSIHGLNSGPTVELECFFSGTSDISGRS